MKNSSLLLLLRLRRRKLRRASALTAPRVRGAAGYWMRRDPEDVEEARDEVDEEEDEDGLVDGRPVDGLLRLRYHGCPANENDEVVDPTEEDEAEERDPDERGDPRGELYAERGELYADGEREERDLYIVAAA